MERAPAMRETIRVILAVAVRLGAAKPDRVERSRVTDRPAAGVFAQRSEFDCCGNVVRRQFDYFGTEKFVI